MPIRNAFMQEIPLKNELSGTDFNSVACEWLYGNFESGYVYPALDPDLSPELAEFLNSQTRGPYYVHETYNQGHGAEGKLMSVVLLHPEDRTAFSATFGEPFWKEEPRAPDKNARVLHFQLAQGFTYENRAMQKLMRGLERLGVEVEFQGADIDRLARQLWKPEQKLLGYTPALRLSASASGPKI